MINIRDTEAPLSSEAIGIVEDRLGIVLPNEYRDFLLLHNGGRPRPAVFRFKNSSGKYVDSSVDWFLAIYEGEHDNFESYFETYKRDQQRLPTELVPIAHDPGGNLICISVSGSQKGAVFFWDHENECGIGETPTFWNVHVIAESFTEFLSSLQDH